MKHLKRTQLGRSGIASALALTVVLVGCAAGQREESVSGAVPAESGEEFRDAEVQVRLEEFLAYFTGYPVLGSFTQEDCANVLTFAVYKLESEQDERIVYGEEEERYNSFLPEIQGYIEEYFDIPEVQGSPYGEVHYIERSGKIVFYPSRQPRGGQPEIDSMRLIDGSHIAVWGHIKDAPEYVEGLDSIVLRDFQATVLAGEDGSYRLCEFVW